VSEKGEICVNTLKKDWDATRWNLQNIFEVIKALLFIESFYLEKKKT
jgi:ubiquitin-conjugating enzyme E2 S